MRPYAGSGAARGVYQALFQVGGADVEALSEIPVVAPVNVGAPESPGGTVTLCTRREVM